MTEAETENQKTDPVAKTGGFSAVQRARFGVWTRRYVWIAIITAVVFAAEKYLSNSLSTEVIAFVFFAIYGLLLLSDTAQTSNGLHRLFSDALGFDKPITAGMIFRDRHNALQEMAIVDLMMSALTIPVIVSALAIINGNLRYATAVPVYIAAVALLAWSKLLAGPGNFRAYFGLLLIFVVLPFAANQVTTLDEFAAPSSEYLLQFAGRMATTVAMIIALVILMVALAEIVVPRLFDLLLRFLPIRRKLMSAGTGINNALRALEFSFLADIYVVSASSLALGAIVYLVAARSDPYLTFILYNLSVVLPSAIAFLRVANGHSDLQVAVFQRVTLLYSAVTMLMLNILTLSGYLIGYLATTGYTFMFGSIGAHPIPDLLYELRYTSLVDLPLAEQLQAYLSTLLIVFSVSWLFSTISNGRWRELFLTSIATLALAAGPYLSDDLWAFVRTNFSFVETIPAWILALLLPACQYLLSREADDAFRHYRACPSCKRLADEADRFCSNCGQAIEVTN